MLKTCCRFCLTLGMSPLFMVLQMLLEAEQQLSITCTGLRNTVRRYNSSKMLPYSLCSFGVRIEIIFSLIHI